MFKKIIFFIFFLSPLSIFAKRKPVVLLDPSGHSKALGRWLLDSYERAETLKFAKALKSKLEKEYKVCVVLSRSPSEEIVPLRIPSFSNRLGADFFLRINIYREEQVKPKLFLYHLLFDPMIDLAKRNFDPISFVPLHEAHFRNINSTISFGKKMYKSLSQDFYKKYFDCYPLKGLPLKALVGVSAPAILLEIGVCQGECESLIDPIIKSLYFLRHSL